MTKQPLVHQLPLTCLLLSAQCCCFSSNVRGHDREHAVLHVLQHTAPEL